MAAKHGGMRNMDGRKTELTTVQAQNRAVANFMEIDGTVGESSGDKGGICLVNRKIDVIENSTINQGHDSRDIGREKEFENERTILDIKRKRVDDGKKILVDGLDNITDSTSLVGPKNEEEAGPVVQARLQQ